MPQGRVKKRELGPKGSSNSWWKGLSGKAQADCITGLLHTLRDNQKQRLDQYVLSSRLYGNLDPSGQAGISWSQMAANHPAMRDKISYNATQSAVDTITAKISKNKPRPLFLTSGGDYRAQRKAKKLTQYTDGIFSEEQAYRKGLIAFRDGAVWGDGLVRVYAGQDKRVHYDRAMAAEFFVDELEAFYGTPQQAHHVRIVNRDALKAAYPKSATAIDRANPAEMANETQGRTIADIVEVRESWRLPSHKDSGDGFHIVTIDGEALTPLEEWKRNHFPIARFSWSPRLYGYFSQGGVEQVQNLQLELNAILRVIQRSFKLGAGYKILLAQGSKVVREQLNREIGALIYYAGVKPEYVVPPMVSGEVYQHLVTVKQAIFETLGVSQLSAISEKPAGLNSGRALREYEDIESDRFKTIGQSYEAFYMDLAAISIATSKEIAEEDGGYEVSVPERKFLSTVNWKDIDLSEDEYVMQCFPTSSLPNEPAGRLQTIQEMTQAGWLTQRQSRRLMDFPDLDQVENLANAQEDYLAMVFDKIVDKGELTAPDALDDPQLAQEMATEYYKRGQLQGLEQERLDMLTDYLKQLAAVNAPPPPQLAPGQPPPSGAGAPPPGGGPPGTPQGAPLPAPTSDLMPQA